MRPIRFELVSLGCGRVLDPIEHPDRSWGFCSRDHAIVCRACAAISTRTLLDVLDRLEHDIASGRVQPAAFSPHGAGAGRPAPMETRTARDGTVYETNGEGYLLSRGSVCGAREILAAIHNFVRGTQL